MSKDKQWYWVWDSADLTRAPSAICGSSEMDAAARFAANYRVKFGGTIHVVAKSGVCFYRVGMVS